MIESDDDFGALSDNTFPDDFSITGLRDDFRAPEVHLRVLVVDDHPTHRRCAQAIFEALGCTVALEESGPAALEAWARGNFDLLLMDRHMPGGHGDEAVRRLRRREGSGQRTFVACCSSDPPRDLSAGYDVVAPKPLTVAVAADLLRRAVAHARAAGDSDRD
jgi:CheY-like chemotaxis protein